MKSDIARPDPLIFFINWNKSGNGRKGVKRIVSLTIIGDY